MTGGTISGAGTRLYHSRRVGLPQLGKEIAVHVPVGDTLAQAPQLRHLVSVRQDSEVGFAPEFAQQSQCLVAIRHRGILFHEAYQSCPVAPEETELHHRVGKLRVAAYVIEQSICTVARQVVVVLYATFGRSGSLHDDFADGINGVALPLGETRHYAGERPLVGGNTHIKIMLCHREVDLHGVADLLRLCV